MTYQVVDIPFFTGQDESYDKKLLPVGPMRRVENSMFERTGRLVRRKRIKALNSTDGEELAFVNTFTLATGTIIGYSGATPCSTPYSIDRDGNCAKAAGSGPMLHRISSALVQTELDIQKKTDADGQDSSVEMVGLSDEYVATYDTIALRIISLKTGRVVSRVVSTVFGTGTERATPIKVLFDGDSIFGLALVREYEASGLLAGGKVLSFSQSNIFDTDTYRESEIQVPQWVPYKIGIGGVTTPVVIRASIQQTGSLPRLLLGLSMLTASEQIHGFIEVNSSGAIVRQAHISPYSRTGEPTEVSPFDLERLTMWAPLSLNDDWVMLHHSSSSVGFPNAMKVTWPAGTVAGIQTSIPFGGLQKSRVAKSNKILRKQLFVASPDIYEIGGTPTSITFTLAGKISFADKSVFRANALAPANLIEYGSTVETLVVMPNGALAALTDGRTGHIEEALGAPGLVTSLSDWNKFFERWQLRGQRFGYSYGIVTVDDGCVQAVLGTAEWVQSDSQDLPTSQQAGPPSNNIPFIQFSYNNDPWNFYERPPQVEEGPNGNIVAVVITNNRLRIDVFGSFPRGSQAGFHNGVEIAALPCQTAFYSGECRMAGYLSQPGAILQTIAPTGNPITDPITGKFYSGLSEGAFGGLLWRSGALPPKRDSVLYRHTPTAGVWVDDSARDYYKYIIAVPAIGFGGLKIASEYKSEAGKVIIRSPSEEVLYTSGGVANNEAPPPCDSLVFASGRMWAGGLHTDPFRIQCSKVLAPDLGVEWSNLDTFFVTLPTRVVALGSLDNAVIAFCEDAAYIINGSGPDNRGIGDLGSPQRVPMSSPCVSKFTITVDSGVIFVSRRGLEMIPRGFSAPIFVGQTVSDVVGDFPVCLGVVKMTDDSSVRWLFGKEDGSATIVVAFNQRASSWSVLSYEESFFGIGVTDDRMILLGDTLESTRIETEDEDDDIGDFVVTQTWETGWLRLGGLNGSAYARRINVLGTHQGGNSSVKISFSYDDKKDWHSKSKTWQIGGTDYEAGDDVCLELMIPVQKVKSIRFKVEVTGNFQGNGISVFYDSEGEGPRVSARSKG